MNPRILILNGSPHAAGCTARALEEVIRILHEEGIETELVHIGAGRVPRCNGCGQCRNSGLCIIPDAVNEAVTKLKDADGLIVGSPVYFGSARDDVLAFLDRLFCCDPAPRPNKIGAVVVSSWGGRNPGSFDALYENMLACEMQIVPDIYENRVRGRTPERVEKDEEGLHAMRTLSRNIASMIRRCAVQNQCDR